MDALSDPSLDCSHSAATALARAALQMISHPRVNIWPLRAEAGGEGCSSLDAIFPLLPELLSESSQHMRDQA